jgi:hypothetical protein
MDAMTQAIEADTGTTVEELPILGYEQMVLKRRLGPLAQIEGVLIKRLSPVQLGERGPDESGENPSGVPLKEVAVNAATQWKESFRTLAGAERTSTSHPDWDDPNDPGRLLHICCGDMVRLWKDPSIQQLLQKLEIHMEDHAG